LLKVLNNELLQQALVAASHRKSPQLAVTGQDFVSSFSFHHKVKGALGFYVFKEHSFNEI